MTLDFNSTPIVGIETLKRKLKLGAGIYVQNERPETAGPWLWFQTGLGEDKKGVTVVLNDGD